MAATAGARLRCPRMHRPSSAPAGCGPCSRRSSASTAPRSTRPQQGSTRNRVAMSGASSAAGIHAAMRWLTPPGLGEQREVGADRDRRGHRQVPVVRGRGVGDLVAGHDDRVHRGVDADRRAGQPEVVVDRGRAPAIASGWPASSSGSASRCAPVSEPLPPIAIRPSIPRAVSAARARSRIAPARPGSPRGSPRSSRERHRRWSGCGCAGLPCSDSRCNEGCLRTPSE